MAELTSELSGIGDSFTHDIHWTDNTGRVRHEYLLFTIRGPETAPTLVIRVNSRVVFTSSQDEIRVNGRVVFTSSQDEFYP